MAFYGSISTTADFNYVFGGLETAFKLADIGSEGDGFLIFGRVQFPLAVCAHILGKIHEILSDVIFILNLLHNPPLLDMDNEGFKPFDGISLKSTEEFGQESARGVGFRATSRIYFLVEG